MFKELRNWYDAHRTKAATMPTGEEICEKIRELMGDWQNAPERDHAYWLVRNTPHGKQMAYVIPGADVVSFSGEGHVAWNVALEKGYSWKRLYTAS